MFLSNFVENLFSDKKNLLSQGGKKTKNLLNNDFLWHYNGRMKIKKLEKIKICSFTLTVMLLFLSCTDKQTKLEIKKHQQFSQFNSYVIQNQKENDEKLEKYFQNLTLEQKISQMFIENLEGCTKFRSYETVGKMNSTNDDTPLVAGGYLFFSYNIAETREKQKQFIQTIYDYCDENNLIYPYLAVDQEGGYVNRLKQLNDKLPSNKEVSQNYTITQAYSLYSNQAVQMKDLGFHMNLAPVIEVETADNADFLDGRSYGTLQNVIDYGRTCVNAYENNNLATVIKHFPGNTNTDPHTGLPEITLAKEELEQSILSFKEILKYNPTAILMSHARTSAIDGNVPSCLSKVWVTDILRNEYNYEGIIFSDDIFMGALADNGYPPQKAVILAIQSGVDCIMISEKRFASSAKIVYEKAINDDDFLQRIDKASFRIIKYKYKNGLLKI